MLSDLFDGRPAPPRDFEPTAYGKEAESEADGAAAPAEPPPPAAAASALMRDLLVSGPPLPALQQHWAAHSPETLARRTHTLVDPLGMWAPSVLKSLADAAGQPVERMQLRESTSLRTVAVVERTMLPQRDDEPLYLQHSDDSRSHDRGTALALALMPHSQLCSLLIGPMTPPAIDALLIEVLQASLVPGWQCPALHFLLPHNAAWIANKVSSIDWPAHLQVQCSQELLTSTSEVWHALQAGWSQARNLPRRDAAALAASRARAAPVERTWVDRLDTLLPLPGVMACAAIDASDGGLLAHRTGANAATSMARTALRLATWLRAETASLPGRGTIDPLEELLATSGQQVQLLRRAAGPRPVYWLVLMARESADVSAVREHLLTL